MGERLEVGFTIEGAISDEIGGAIGGGVPGGDVFTDDMADRFPIDDSHSEVSSGRECQLGAR